MLRVCATSARGCGGEPDAHVVRAAPRSNTVDAADDVLGDEGVVHGFERDLDALLERDGLRHYRCVFRDSANAVGDVDPGHGGAEV
jgi:hypothetical protein